MRIFESNNREQGEAGGEEYSKENQSSDEWSVALGMPPIESINPQPQEVTPPDVDNHYVIDGNPVRPRTGWHLPNGEPSDL